MTHTATHTPGPWYVTASHELGYVVSDNGETIVPFGHHAGDMTPERWCNAHLIAAAPAMYGDIASLAGVEGTVTIHKGIACLPDGTTINLLATKAQAEGTHV